MPWVSRRRYDLLTADAGRAQTLERNEALLRQHVDWLTAAVNRLEGERALYLQRLIGLNVPVAQVTAVPPGQPQAVAGAGVPRTDDTHEPVAGIDVGVLQLGAAAFEDMGNDEAARQGIGQSEAVVSLR